MEHIYNSIKNSFGIYAKYIQNSTKGSNYHIDKEYDVESMNIVEIKSETNYLYMSYILAKTSYSYDDKSPAVLGYNHLMKMIEDVKITIKPKN